MRLLMAFHVGCLMCEALQSGWPLTSRIPGSRPLNLLPQDEDDLERAYDAFDSFHTAGWIEAASDLLQ